ncbi:unnamed protein product [Rotaria magnacalcarata]
MLFITKVKQFINNIYRNDANQNYPCLIFYFLEMNLPDRDQSTAIDLKTKQYLIFQGEYLRGIRNNRIKTLSQTNLALKNVRHQLDNEMLFCL